MKQVKKFGIGIAVLFISAASIFFILTSFIDNDQELEDSIDSERHSLLSLELVTLGDSLTEGIGDSANRGGYVPLAAEALRENENIRRVSTRNHGVSGDTTNDLLHLLEEDEEVQISLSQGNIVSITIGANDLVGRFRQVGLDGELEDFEASLSDFEDNLNQIISEIRSHNEEATIYLFGIYNPYYYYFSEFEALQQVFDMWNEAIESRADQEGNIRFVEIDSLFNPDDMDVASEDELDSVDDMSDIEDDVHPYLYEEDAFHPNDEGYHLMANALVEKIEQELEE